MTAEYWLAVQVVLTAASLTCGAIGVKRFENFGWMIAMWALYAASLVCMLNVLESS